MRPRLEMPDPDASFEGAPVALRNADAHVAAADMLHHAQQHGLAVAHLVLGAEEAVKAASLAIHSLGGVHEEKVLRSILGRHSTRHGSAGLFLTTIWAHEQIARGETPQRDPESTEILSWWFSADRLKMRGLYVDFRDGAWATPEGVEPGDYSRSRVHVTRFLEIARGMVERIAQLSPEERRREGEEHRMIASEIEACRKAEQMKDGNGG